LARLLESFIKDVILNDFLARLDVRTQGAKDVAEFLLAEIQGGRLPAGVKLPSERTLSARFNVSRGSVRRVLAEFRDQGLIEPALGSGTFVSSKAERLLVKSTVIPAMNISPAELMEARQLIEPLMPALIVRNATAADFTRMQECLDKSEQATTIDDFEHWDGELHKTFALATHNSFFLQVLELTNKVREQAEWGALKRNSLTPARRQQYEEQHRQIVAALIDRDAERAQATLRGHLNQIHDNLFKP